MKREDSHISDENLLLSVDGELSPRVAARVQAHLSNCWECRTRRQEIESAIADFIRIRQRSIDPLLPPIAGPRAMLRAQLSQLGETHPTKWLDWLAENVSARAAIFAALVVLLLVALFRLSLTPPVSASEILSRTRQAEVRQVGRIASPVIYEKLQLSRHSGSHLDTATWEIWNDTAHQRLRQRADSEGEGAGHVIAIPSTGPAREARPVSDLVEIYRSHQADLGRPLCAANYETWRAAIPQVSETVREGQLPDGEKATILQASGQGYAPPEALDEGDGAMRPGDVAAGLPRHDVEAFSELSDATPSPGATRHPLPQGGEGVDSISPNRIIKAELVVRSADWHPVEERLWVDDREYKIAELDYKVIPLAEVDPLVFEVPRAPVEPVEAPRPVLVEVPATLEPPPPPDSNETEMAVRYGLYGLDADFGQPIQITTDDEGEVIVDAAGVNPELQAKLEQQLAPIPNVKLEFGRNKELACETCVVAPPETADQVPSPPPAVVPGVNPAETRLQPIFRDPRAQETFTRAVLAAIGDALAHCAALRDLALRYPPEEEARLAPISFGQLNQMVEHHFTALVERANLLQGLLQPLLEAGSTPDAGSPKALTRGAPSQDAAGATGLGSKPAVSPASALSDSSWQSESIELYGVVQKVDLLVRDLLTNTRTSLPEEEVLPNLNQTLGTLQQELHQIVAPRANGDGERPTTPEPEQPLHAPATER